MAAPPAQQAGSIRGLVMDADFDVPMAAVEVRLVSAESNQATKSDAQGVYTFPEVSPGSYNLIFSKEGYLRTLKTDVLVLAGQVTDTPVSMENEFSDMEGFVVTDMLGGMAGSEQALLQLRFDSPALLDTIGSDLMSRSGASDAASALRLVSGASVADGKTAVIRGLPDRYVSSQMNGVRLPSADEDKRSVELDQFPSAIIESVQVSKTFTPDQQGDASGGAVNVELKGLPTEPVLQFGLQSGHNTQVTNNGKYLSYEGGGVNTWGFDDGGRDIQFENLGGNWDGAAGVSSASAPLDYKLQGAFGDRAEYEDNIFLGGFLSFFYERDSSFSDNGVDDSYWVTEPGGPLVPESKQGTPGPNPQQSDFKTALFDITRAAQSVQWGGLASIGVEGEYNSVQLSYLYSHTAEDKAILAEDTRGKAYYFPGYDLNDPMAPGNVAGTTDAAPYLRSQTLVYTERTAGTLQLSGDHTIPIGGNKGGDSFHFLDPKLEWTLSQSGADLDQPDKRQFGSQWTPGSFSPGAPPFIPPSTNDPFYRPLNPAANFNLGNFQRIWKTIEEDSDQYAVDLKLPYERSNGAEGYLKFGVFDDRVKRGFDQETFSNFGDSGSSGTLGWDQFWTDVFPSENHPIFASATDVDYKGKQNLSAWYGMADFPVTETTKLVGGVRFEDTEISTVNTPEADAVWYPPGSSTPVTLGPGDGNVDFQQQDMLPSLALIHEWTDSITLRLSYAETVARQTFKELTPILQQEFLGGPVFIGRPDLRMSNLENYDLRLDYKPVQGSLLSVSYFNKQIEDPIEYVQTASTFTYTTPINYPKGELSGVELEVRQDLGLHWDRLGGFAVGANATFIDSEVQLTPGEIGGFDSIGTPITSRKMVQAPEHLYNLFLTYDAEETGTQLGLFYTVQGDTLVTGAGISDGNFVPSVFATEYDTLNFSVTQALGGPWKLKFQAKNLTNPLIQEVYRSDYTEGDTVHTSYSKGIDYTLAISASFQF
ncbi:MAG TPA: carboxypeptidase regulatory-like domain-containing protein [Planctomycetota bacterium]|nr:carboxypeptidase regulatory-like domain-containing protein [Planctomycetota bacterium]